MDIVSPEVRSRMMSGIRAKNTQPEWTVRKGLHALGFRYRLHQRGLPGRPDVVLARYNAAVFVHGCFWHGHDCRLFRLPASRTEFWRDKIQRNRDNDARQLGSLLSDGWRVATVWECALRGATCEKTAVVKRLAEWIRGGASAIEIRG